MTFVVSSMPSQLVIDEASAFFGNGIDFVDYTEDDIRALFLEALPEGVKGEVSVKCDFMLCLAAFVPWSDSIMDDSVRDDIYDHPKNMVWYHASLRKEQQKLSLSYIGSSFRSFEAALVDLGYAKEEDRKCLKEAEEMQPGCTEIFGDTSWDLDTVFAWEVNYTDLPGSGTS
ncbi:hypothetical protein TI39_contig4299g00001 [Zymoseptoria brevis]|uniref:Uncharacterized protein n=1 Tax=Zymoseptoria brevis TaxID=1047168 RepID=A0A0F4G844_9PEZI|nr:hypothetical protein TI39_contig4299g00001 [Zymoseptoria brevis]